MSSAAARTRRREAAQQSQSRALSDDVDALDRRACGLAAEVTALEGRRSALAGYASAGPVAGADRFHEIAGLAAGGAVAGAVDAGREQIASCVRAVALAMRAGPGDGEDDPARGGSAATVNALVDLASAAMSFAAVISLSAGEETARLPKWEGRADVGPRIEDARAAMRLIADGEVSAVDVIAGRAPGSVVRRLARKPWDTLLLEGGATLPQVIAAATAADIPQNVRLSDLSTDERTQILAAVAAA